MLLSAHTQKKRKNVSKLQFKESPVYVNSLTDKIKSICQIASDQQKEKMKILKGKTC